jgi:hypothetical protein
MATSCAALEFSSNFTDLRHEPGSTACSSVLAGPALLSGFYDLTIEAQAKETPKFIGETNRFWMDQFCL